MKRIALTFCLFVAALLTACSGGPVGSYQADSGQTTLVLKSDNSFEMDTAKKQHVTGTWKVDPTPFATVFFTLTLSVESQYTVSNSVGSDAR